MTSSSSSSSSSGGGSGSSSSSCSSSSTSSSSSGSCSSNDSLYSSHPGAHACPLRSTSLSGAKTLRVKLNVPITHTHTHTHKCTVSRMQFFASQTRVPRLPPGCFANDFDVVSIASMTHNITFDRTARICITRSLRHPSSPPFSLASVNSYHHHHQLMRETRNAWTFLWRNHMVD